jgi:hypothetical protein
LVLATNTVPGWATETTQAREELARVFPSPDRPVYVVLRKDVYDRVRQLLYDDSDATAEELRLRLARAARENGWDEAGMDACDRYDEELRKQCRSNAAT